MRVRYNLARRRAQELLEAAGMVSPPILMEALATASSATISYAPLPGDLSGMVHREANGRAVIGVNASHSLTRQRFTIAHELGHLVLHAHNGPLHIDERNPIGLRDSKSSQATDPMEIEANQFAAELLMPALMLRASVDRLPVGVDADAAVTALAELYQVSPQAMSYRLANLRVIQWE